MRKWIPVVLLFIGALGGIWFWSLGSLPEESMALARVSEKPEYSSVIVTVLHLS